MPDCGSNLVSSHKNIINGTSDSSETKISDEKGSVKKRRVTQTEKNGYPDSIYLNAAKIFQGIHIEKSKERMRVQYGNISESPMMAFKDEHSRRLSYELAFNGLKYQDLLEEILLDSGTYPCYAIPDELTSLLVVMLYDLQDRKFQKRKIFDEEEVVTDVQEIGHYLYSLRTKLAAALARLRIKHDALSVEYFVPKTLWKQEQKASALPVYVWINTFKISLEDAMRDLEMKGLTNVKSVSDFDHYTYAVDQHCHDVLVFPSSLKEDLLNLDLFADCKLILQDKPRSLAVHSARALLSEGGDVIVAHIGSYLTIAHLSVLTNRRMSRIFVCGVKSAAKEELRDSFSRLGCENIQLLAEDFAELEPTDPRLQKAKVILLLPQCSGLGAGNPMEFMLSEHRDAGLLQDLFHGFVSEDKLSILAERHLNELIHALKFNKVQAIVYSTCSIYPEENELVVKKALKFQVEGPKVQPYRLIPSVFSTRSKSKASTEIFFKMEPSEISSGCFLAVLQREKATSKKVPAIDSLAYAAESGVIDGIVEEEPKEEVKKEKGKGRKHKASDSKPKAAKLLTHQTGAKVKAEVSASKAVSNIQEKPECPKKPASNIQEKPVGPKKPASNIQEKPVGPKKPASNIQEKPVCPKKPASNIQEKPVSPKKPASDIQEKPMGPKKPASNIQEKPVGPKKPASNIQEKPVCHTKADSNIQEKRVHRKKAASNKPKKTVQRRKAASNKPKKTVQRRKAASNIPQKNVQRRKAASNIPQKNVQRTNTASNVPQKNVQRTKAASNTQQKNVPQTKAVSNISMPKAVSNISMPKAVSNISMPKAVSNRSVPQAVSNRSVPQAVNNTSVPKAVSNTTVLQAVSNTSVPKAVSNIQQKNVPQTDSHMQLKTSVKPDLHTAPAKVPKCASHLSPLSKADARRTPARKACAEQKKVVLKPWTFTFPSPENTT